MPLPSVQQFERALKQQMVQLKLRSLDALEGKPELLTQLVADKAVQAYLTRPFDDIRFDEKGNPLYESEMERQLYEVCSRQESTHIPYRGDLQKGSYDGIEFGFYHSGRSKQGKHIFNGHHQQRLKALDNQRQPHTHVMVASGGGDFLNSIGAMQDFQYSGRTFAYPIHDADGKPITAETLPKEGISCLLFDTGKIETGVGHALVMAGIIDNATRKLKTILFLNSHPATADTLGEYDLRMNDLAYRGRNDFSVRDEAIGKGEGAETFADEPIHIVDVSLGLQTEEGDFNCGLYASNFTHALMEVLVERPELIEPLTKDDWKQDPRLADVHQAAKDHARQKALTRLGGPFCLPEGMTEKEAEALREAMVNRYDEYMEKVGPPLHEPEKGLYRLWSDHSVKSLQDKFGMCRTEAYRAARVPYYSRMDENKYFNQSSSVREIAAEQASPIREAIKERLPQYYHKIDGELVQRPADEIKQEHLKMRWEAGQEFLQQMAEQVKRPPVAAGR